MDARLFWILLIAVFAFFIGTAIYLRVKNKKELAEMEEDNQEFFGAVVVDKIMSEYVSRTAPLNRGIRYEAQVVLDDGKRLLLKVYPSLYEELSLDCHGELIVQNGWLAGFTPDEMPDDDSDEHIRSAEELNIDAPTPYEQTAELKEWSIDQLFEEVDKNHEI